MRSLTRSFLIRVSACLLVVAVASPAYATTFYVALDTLSKTCRIMVTEPDGQAMRMLGRAHASYDEAEAAMRSLDECSA